MTDEERELYGAAFDEMLAGKWRPICAGELKPGMKMRDMQGGVAEIIGVYPSANESVFVEAKNRMGAHIPKNKIVLIRPTK